MVADIFLLTKPSEHSKNVTCGLFCHKSSKPYPCGFMVVGYYPGPWGLGCCMAVGGVAVGKALVAEDVVAKRKERRTVVLPQHTQRTEQLHPRYRGATEVLTL